MMGIDSYEWRTAGDERVRDDHDICDGVIYKYGQQTDSNTGAEPAQDVNCRCVAISIITDDVLGQIL
jgi:SPP1 gp7 family putative phage head morphogenesis protein